MLRGNTACRHLGYRAQTSLRTCEQEEVSVVVAVLDLQLLQGRVVLVRGARPASVLLGRQDLHDALPHEFLDEQQDHVPPVPVLALLHPTNTKRVSVLNKTGARNAGASAAGTSTRRHNRILLPLCPGG